MKPWLKILALCLLALAGTYQLEHADFVSPATGDAHPLRRAYQQQLEKVWVYDVEATVRRILPDDTQGSRHQRLLVTTNDIPSLLIAHNIDKAPRVPVQVGDTVIVSGRYEWNDKGGVIHWTHRDSDGRRSGGGIQFQGEVYR